MDQAWETADCPLHNPGSLFSLSDSPVNQLSSLLPHHSSYVKGPVWSAQKITVAVAFTVREVWRAGMLLGGQRGQTQEQFLTEPEVWARMRRVKDKLLHAETPRPRYVTGQTWGSHTMNTHSSLAVTKD